MLITLGVKGLTGIFWISVGLNMPTSIIIEQSHS